MNNIKANVKEQYRAERKRFLDKIKQQQDDETKKRQELILAGNKKGQLKLFN